jgi:transposase
MIWGAFSAFGKLKIAFIETRLDSFGYQKVLEEHLLPFLNKFPAANHIFMQDNAAIHASRSTSDWLKNNNIETISWPSKSPDINPIENVWGILVRDIYSDCRQYETKEQLKIAIENAWDRISSETLKNLINSMPKRMNLLIKSSGKPINY